MVYNCQILMIKPLTSLRFFFAFIVFLSHYRVGGIPLFSDGHLGVTFFFILSGFILSYSYKQRLEQRQISKSDFYVARFARIYPLHLLTLLTSVALMVYNKECYTGVMEWVKHLLPNLLLVQSFVPLDSIYFAFNSVSWSISDEVFFYALFPAIIALRVRAVGGGKPLVALFLLGLYIALLWVLPDRWQHPLFYIHPLFRLVDFIIGMALYNGWQHYNQQANSRFRALFTSRRSATILEFSSLILLAIFIGLAPMVPSVYKYALYYWLPMTLVLFVFAQTNLSTAGAVSSFLSKKWMVLLGEASFGFYMIHPLVIVLINAILKHLDWTDIWWGYNFLIILASIIILSIACFYLFERPCNRFIKQRYQQLKVALRRR